VADRQTEQTEMQSSAYPRSALSPTTGTICCLGGVAKASDVTQARHPIVLEPTLAQPTPTSTTIALFRP